ncbi:pentatricopeptide repeat-containing protein At4g13650-like [Zingiber officinale]|uniref:Pentatricopeptide repeat-containing protein n=1 Tax=Zingiber officinale TaxID=94328 RepID=A0A8J5KM67_ZINOF|nr:pentatricopeptide repeat-containing protein At4g13650-like [Zingiber officinale]KAG6482118.1 hypothetical protein ZIOFF_058749 [Zingiber officinale]
MSLSDELSPISSDELSRYLKHRRNPRAVSRLSLKLGRFPSTFLCDGFLRAYASLSMPAYARDLFDEMPQPNVTVASLKELLAGRVVHGYDGQLPLASHLGTVIAGCSRARDLRSGQQTHCAAVKLGVERDRFVSSTLIAMYGKCGKLNESFSTFLQTPQKDTVICTSIITSLATSRGDQTREAALTVFRDMIGDRIWPVDRTFVSLIKLFDAPERLRQGKQVHGCVLKLGVQVDDQLGSALISMYGRCGSVGEAVRLSARVNMDAVSWTSLLVAYTQNGYDLRAIDLFRSMIGSNVVVDRFMVASAIGACSGMEKLRLGEEIHGYALRQGFLADVSVCNALITLYGRCNLIEKAERLFKMLRVKDMISWTALLTCYGQNGCGEEAIVLFREMLRRGIGPAKYCISGAIRASSTIASLAAGEQLHCRAMKTGNGDDLSVHNSLIAMYAKCGCVELARRVFELMNCRDVVSWNAMITGFSQHGREGEALELFDKMSKEGIRPDDYTFVGVLVSCSRLGLVAHGCSYFGAMSAEHGLEPKMEHYACMVDLFGRAGKLQDAMELINAMPFEPDQLVWEALLASCKIHGNVDLVKSVAQRIMEMRPEDPSPYIALSTMYASTSMWERKAFVQAMMKDARVRKDPGKSWIESQQVSDHSHHSVYSLQMVGI